jgi:hypothetical protein
MKHIKTFEQFVNESEATNESSWDKGVVLTYKSSIFKRAQPVKSSRAISIALDNAGIKNTWSSKTGEVFITNKNELSKAQKAIKGLDIEYIDEATNEAFSDKNLKDVYKAMKGVEFTRNEGIPKWKTLFADFTFQNWQDMIKHWDQYGDDRNKRDMDVYHALSISMLINQHGDIVFGSGSAKTKDGYSRQDLKDWYENEYKANEAVIVPFIPFSSHASSSPGFESSPYAIIGIGIFIAAGFASLYAADSGYFDRLSKWWNKWRLDRKINKIVERLRDDQDILDFLQLSASKQKGKWEKLLSSKLNDEEERYLKSINKKHFANEAIIESYDEFLNEGFKQPKLDFDYLFQIVGRKEEKDGSREKHEVKVKKDDKLADIKKQVLKDYPNNKYYYILFKTKGKMMDRVETNESVNEANLEYQEMWDDLDTWAKKSKYPAWRIQKDYLKTIAPSYDINIDDKEWKKMIIRYDELWRKDYFKSWESGQVWLDKKIKELNK